MRIDRSAPIENSGKCFLRPLAKVVEHSGLMNARNCTEWRAALRPRRFAPDIVQRVLIERNAGSATLLRAVMHQPVLTDIQEPAAGAAVPIVRQSSPDVVLEMIEMRERKQTGFETPETIIDTPLLLR